MSIRKAGQVIAGTPNITTGHHVGEIFYTSRLDNELNGAVDADGTVYSVEAFTGEQSVPALLADDKLSYVSMAEYESIVSANGSCRAFGWDNGDTFRVPTAEKMKRVLVAKKEPTDGNYDWYNLYSDGWLEQGGYIYQAGNTTGVANTTTFPKAFKNNDYSLTMFAGVGNSGWQYANGVGLGTGGAGVNARESYTTPTTFTWFNATGVTGAPIFWEAKGYAEIPTEAEYQFQNIETHRAMVQLATGVQEDATQLKEYKFNNPHFFGESKWTDVDPMNASWLISNGNFHLGATYTDMYKQLQVELNTSLNVGDTVEIDGRTFVKRGFPVKLLTDTYDDYDFVVNQDDQTFRFPLVSERVLVAKKEATTEDPTWYNLYSDGWLEQGGNQLARWTSGENRRINFVKPFANNNYSLAYSNGTPDMTTMNWKSAITARDKNGFNFQHVSLAGNSCENNFSYISCGYAPVPTQSDFTEVSGLYFYVGDVLQDPALINAGAVLDYFSKLNTVHCVVETFKSGNSWYRVYDDGWVEQGGTLSLSACPQTITLLKQYQDNNYTICIGGGDPDSNAAVCSTAVYSRAVGSFSLVSGYGGTFHSCVISWMACGYGA